MILVLIWILDWHDLTIESSCSDPWQLSAFEVVRECDVNASAAEVCKKMTSNSQRIFHKRVLTPVSRY